MLDLILSNVDLISAAVGAVATVVVFLVRKLPGKIKAAVASLFDKVDAELDKDNNAGV